MSEIDKRVGEDTMSEFTESGDAIVHQEDPDPSSEWNRVELLCFLTAFLKRLILTSYVFLMSDLNTY